VQRPAPQAVWEPGHWSQQPSGGYVWVDGHWQG
jgi:WXXGXW repeat (2 copies)